jgi:GalNAc-alpha-(1->4)-GalNAc-alpha-(1->3)-diNAcBac-PP-undecaprenol alpha-1,4-N-acetyl-D-galactosaminyltransferase
MRVMFVARAINRIAGGVERMVTMLMNALVDRHHSVDLLTWDLANAEAFYPIAAEITWHRLNMGNPQARASNLLRLRRARTIRSLIARRKPQVIVCFQDGPFIALRAFTLGLQIPIIACERNSPSRFDHISVARYREGIYQSFRLAACIVIQCESYKALYPNYLHRRIVCIPNPVSPATFYAKPDVHGASGRYRLLSVGRLSFQKNYNVLIQAFACLAQKFPNWDLAIVGEGEDRTRLEALIRACGLETRVTLPGTTNSIGRWYCSSHLFCLPSRWEGFPNALAEALSHGLPAVGFKDCAGMQDLIAHGHCGLLADGNGEPESLAIALENLMSNGELRRSMGLEGIETVKRFDPQEIFLEWEEVLRKVANSKSLSE